MLNRASPARTAPGARSQRAREIEPPANGTPRTSAAGSEGARASHSDARMKSGSSNDDFAGNGAGRRFGMRARSIDAHPIDDLAVEDPPAVPTTRSNARARPISFKHGGNPWDPGADRGSRSGTRTL